MKKLILLSLIIGLIIIACLKLKDVRVQHRELYDRRTPGPLEECYYYPEVQGYVTNFGNTVAESVLIHLTIICNYPSPRQAEVDRIESFIDSVELKPKFSCDFEIKGKLHSYQDKPKSYTISILTVTWR